MTGMLSAIIPTSSWGYTWANGQSTVKPNVLYIIADQWRASATGYIGDPNLGGRTPNIDRLVRKGLNFGNAVPVCLTCTPHRALDMQQKHRRLVGNTLKHWIFKISNTSFFERFIKYGNSIN